MPEMAAVCQDPTGTPPSMFGGRGPQGIGPPHGYYNHCGYQTPAPHGHYASDGYGTFQQTPQAEPATHQQHHLQPQHLPQHHHNQQQSWGYGLPMAANGRNNHGAIGDEWTYMVPGGSSTPTQNHYNYQYRPNTHTSLDYASPLSAGQDTTTQGLDGSPSPGAPSPGESPGAGIGPNNQGAKSLRPPYEWMKPSAGLPQSGKTRTKDKYRVVYSDHQRLELEKEFHFSKYITIRRKTEIAGQLGLSERQVKIWFQNRRAKERKQNKKRQEVPSELQHPTGGSGSNHSSNHHQEQPHQHQMLQGAAHDTHPHLFLKTEKEDEFPIKHELTGHSSATLTPLIPLQGQGGVVHQSHHTMGMIGAPAILGRGHAHPVMPRYHEGVVQRPAMTPPSPGGDLSYRLAGNNGTDSAGNSMNLSGSSDSGVLSSH